MKVGEIALAKIVVKTDRMTEVRIKQGFSYRQLSQITSVNLASLSKIEKGARSPTPKNAKLISNALGVDFDDIFEIVKEERSVRL